MYDIRNSGTYDFRNYGEYLGMWRILYQGTIWQISAWPYSLMKGHGVLITVG